MADQTLILFSGTLGIIILFAIFFWLIYFRFTKKLAVVHSLVLKNTFVLMKYA